jgi:hypothetical protein
MAVIDVIHFPFWAQLATRPRFPALLLPEPIAKSLPDLRHAKGAVRLGVHVVQDRLRR